MPRKKPAKPTGKKIGRPRGSKTPDFASLTEAQVIAAEALARGELHHVVAAMAGVTEPQIHTWHKSPKFRTAVDLFRHGAVDHVIKIRGAAKILEDAGPQAATTLIQTLASEKEEIKQRAATEILDRTGHGKKSKCIARTSCSTPTSSKTSWKPKKWWA